MSEPQKKAVSLSHFSAHKFVLNLRKKNSWQAVVGVSLIALISSAGVTTAMRRKASEAYVTGDLITVKSPIKGEVIKADLRTGELFPKGVLLITVRASREQAAKQEEARLQLGQVDRDIASAKQQIKMLLQANQARLSDALQTAMRALNDLNGQSSRYQQQVNRYRQLVQAGAMDGDTLAGAEANLNSVTQKLQNQKRIVADLKRDLERASAGLTQEKSSLPESSSGLGLLELDISRLSDRLSSLQSRKKKLQDIAAYGSRQMEFNFKSAFSGLVLSKRVAPGSEVVAGETLFTAVNCQELKAEAVFESGKLRTVQIGDMVKVSSKRDQTSVQGRVTSLRGVKGIRALEGTDSAQFKATSDDRTRMQIALPKEFHTGQCRLGERVEVSL